MSRQISMALPTSRRADSTVSGNDEQKAVLGVRDGEALEPELPRSTQPNIVQGLQSNII